MSNRMFNRWYSDLLYDAMVSWGLPVPESRPLLDAELQQREADIVQTLEYNHAGLWIEIRIFVFNQRYGYCWAMERKRGPGPGGTGSVGFRYGAFIKFSKPFQDVHSAIVAAAEAVRAYDKWLYDDKRLRRWLLAQTQGRQLRLDL